MINYIQEGKHITIPAPYAVKSSEPILKGAFFGFATTDAAQGEDVATAVAGVFEAQKDNSAFDVGDEVYFNVNKKLFSKTADAGASAKIGVAVNAVTELNGTVKVLLNRQAVPVPATSAK